MKFMAMGNFTNIVFLIIIFCLSLTLSATVLADCENVLENNIGWTILDSKTIEGWRDTGGEKEDGFEGCDYGRIIYFLDGTQATCNSYGYQYAYMPTAIILGNNIEYKGKAFTLIKMIVGCEEYDLQ